MKNILFIPFAPAIDTVTRPLEFANALAKDNLVYYLTWGKRRKKNSLIYDLVYGAREFVRLPSERIVENLTFVQTSKFFRPYQLADRYNAWQIKQIILKFKIDLVVNGSHINYPIIPINGVKQIYDLADDHVAGMTAYRTDHPSKIDQMRKHLKHQLSAADKVTVASNHLCEKLLLEYGQDSTVVPNGARVALLRNVNPALVQEHKRSLGLAGKFVIGLIANIGPWSGIDFLLEVFGKFKQLVPEAALLVVGFGSEFEKSHSFAGDREDIVLLSRRSPKEMPVYFSLIDIGLDTIKQGDFFEARFPIKIIEYTTARKMVVSTPTPELVRLGFPNVSLVERDVDKWVKALLEARDREWKPEWDKGIEEYDWKILAQRLISGC